MNNQIDVKVKYNKHLEIEGYLFTDSTFVFLFTLLIDPPRGHQIYTVQLLHTHCTLHLFTKCNHFWAWLKSNYFNFD
jgi:hypothetical protein